MYHGGVKIMESFFIEKLGQLKQPVVTAYELGLIFFSIYKERDVSSFLSDYQKKLKAIIELGILKQIPKTDSKNAYIMLGHDTPSPEETACYLDAFCYISHLSAMEYHGLTDRFSTTVFLSSPKDDVWKKLINEKIKKDLNEDSEIYISSGLPIPKRLNVIKIGKKNISNYKTTLYNSGSYIKIQDQSLRVSSIGRTFLDMLKMPDFCGGIYHVLDVYKENAEQYLKLITDEIEQHGNAIDKVKAGYVLEERLGLSNETINSWSKYAQRGGSRKLVAKNSYSERFSEKWQLSINIDEIEE